MKRVAIALGLLVAVSAGGIAAAPQLIDWQSFKPEIEALAARTFDGEVAIDGALGVRFLPSPALVADDFRLVTRLGGSQWSADASAGRIRVDLGLGALLTGTIDVERLALEDVELVLEPAASNEPEPLSVDQSSLTDPGAIQTGPSSDVPTVPESAPQRKIEIERGRLILRLPELRGEEIISDISGDIELGGLSDPALLSGAFTWRGIPFEGRLDARAGTERRLAALDLIIADGAGIVEVDGSLTGEDLRDMMLEGRVKLSGADANTLFRAIADAGATPWLVERAFSARGALTAGLGRFELTLDEAGLGDARGTVALAYRPEAPEPWRLDLDVQRLDVDSWIGRPAEAAATGGSPEWMQKLGADVAIRAGAVIYNGQPARDLTATATIRDGIIELEQATAQLPGRTDATLFGSLPLIDPAGPMELGFSVGSENLRGFAAWLGTDLNVVRPGRLGRMTASGRLSGEWPRYEVRDIDMMIDDSRIDGAVIAVLAPRPGFGIGLRVDRLDLDRYFFAPHLMPDAARPDLAQLGASAAEVLDALDANIRLDIGSLGYAGLEAVQSSLDATLYGGGLTVKSLTVADMAGMSLSAAGGVERSDGALNAVELALDLSGPDISTGYAQLLPLMPEGLRRNRPGDDPVRLSVQTSGGLDRLDGQVLLAVGPLTLNAAGHLIDPFSPQRQSDMALSLAHENAGGIMTWLTGADRGMSGAVSATASLIGGEGLYRLDEIRGLISGQELQGALSADLTAERPKIGGALSVRPVDTGRSVEEPTPQATPWSRRSLPLGWLGLADLDVALSAARLGRSVTDATARLTGAEGVVRLEEAAANWGDGRLEIQAEARAVPVGAEISADIAVVDARLETLVPADGAIFRPAGQVNGRVTVTTLGNSPADWISRLAGQGKVTVSDLTGTAAGGAGVPAPLNQPLIDLLEAPLDIANGVISTRDVTLQSGFGDGSAALQADLPRWRLDGRVRLDAEEGTGLPPVRLRLAGPLDAPDTVVTMDGLPAGLFQQR